MPKKIMTRKAADNKYLHKDFHCALNLGLEYVRKHFGDDAVRDYLRQYARSFHAPLIRALRRRGLVALKEYFRNIYAEEGAPVRINCSRDELRLETDYSPAVRHIRQKGFAVSPLHGATEFAVHAAICEDTPFAFELARYDRKIGRSVQRFYRRAP
ncbi:MAG: hypothetical protein PHW60_09510 [Kiritimatiellae bacterium]|nr:hypothetical protein [Kiritimatiellia bacterium]